MAKRLQELSVTRIDVLRHGQCEGGDIFRGHFDAKLTSAGFAQMQDACNGSGCPWQKVISSPLQRCWHFAQSLNSDAQADARLREMSFGDWDGKNISDVWRDDYPRISAWSRDPASHTPPGGESLQAVDARIAEFMADCLRDYQGETILLVTHGGVIRVLLSQILGMPLAHANRWEVPYGCVSQLAVYHQPEGDPPLVRLVAHNRLTAQ